MEIEKVAELNDEELNAVTGGKVDILNAEMNDKGEWVYDRGLCTSCHSGKLIIDHSNKKYDFCKCSSCHKKFTYNKNRSTFLASEGWIK